MYFNTSVDNFRLILELLGPCQQLTFWRDAFNWVVNHKPEAKQVYRGLLNPGCICYMNSLLQQLFMIEEFRLSVLDLELSEDKIVMESEG